MKNIKTKHFFFIGSKKKNIVVYLFVVQLNKNRGKEKSFQLSTQENRMNQDN